MNSWSEYFEIFILVCDLDFFRIFVSDFDLSLLTLDFYLYIVDFFLFLDVSFSLYVDFYLYLGDFMSYVFILFEDTILLELCGGEINVSIYFFFLVLGSGGEAIILGVFFLLVDTLDLVVLVFLGDLGISIMGTYFLFLTGFSIGLMTSSSYYSPIL